MVNTGDTNLASRWAAIEPAVNAALAATVESMKE